MPRLLIKITLALAVSLSASATSSAQSSGYSVDFSPLTGMPSIYEDCVLWLCVPTHFPDGCEDALRTFKKRVVNPQQTSMPSYFSCNAGAMGVSGSYSEGYMRYTDCPAGYVLETDEDEDETKPGAEDAAEDTDVEGESENRPAVCINRDKCKMEDGEEVCPTVMPLRREAPFFIDVTMDGKDYPRYYYKK